MPWPTRNSKSPSKKVEAVGPGGRHRIHRIPRRSRRSLGHRLHERASHGLEPAATPGLGTDWAATHRPWAAPLRLALPGRLCASGLWSALCIRPLVGFVHPASGRLCASGLWSALCIRPLVGLSFIWLPPSALLCLKWNWRSSHARREPVRPSRLCWCSIARAGIPA
jgi:hypothetical protein